MIILMALGGNLSVEGIRIFFILFTFYLIMNCSEISKKKKKKSFSEIAIREF